MCSADVQHPRGLLHGIGEWGDLLRATPEVAACLPVEPSAAEAAAPTVHGASGGSGPESFTPKRLAEAVAKANPPPEPLP